MYLRSFFVNVIASRNKDFVENTMIRSLYKKGYCFRPRHAGLNPQVNILCQTPSMTEAEREGFLAQFAADPERTLVGFALMGGIFGEGIDLIGNRLSGAVIVGVGLPQICTEREIIRAYYQTTNQLGFEFAYMYPGFNKVLQAVGRVIRTEQDRGVVLLIDERFALSIYKRLFPKEWQPVRYVANTEAISKTIGDFWETGIVEVR